MLGCLEEWWLGGIYRPNHQNGHWGKAGVVWRTGQSGAPPDSPVC
jgi:hypothetical protein